jgi:flagellar motility protein MotE (MotC chaperone)
MPRAVKMRLLPALIGLSIVTVGFRTADVASRLLGGTPIEPMSSARAETPKPDAQPAATPAADAASDKPASDKPASDKPAPHALNDTGFSGAEVDMLQTLAKRREELDQRDAGIVQRETMLKVAEDRVNQKVAELNALKGDIEKLLDLQKKKQDDEILSLVKIYSAMKPQDAARIFSTLDMPVLLGVVSRMKEQKSAAIIAAMDPGPARELTTRLSDLRQLPDGAAVPGAPMGEPTALTPAAAAAAANPAPVVPISAPAPTPAPTSASAPPSPQASAAAPAASASSDATPAKAKTPPSGSRSPVPAQQGKSPG